MKVSIITASYNSDLFIKTCLESAVNQIGIDYEYLIIDGNSSDSTITIVEEFSKKYNTIKLFSETDKGIYDALNKGIGLATGDIIGFVHSDDFLASITIVSEIVEKIKNESLDGVYGDLQYVDKLNTKKIIRTWKGCEYKNKLLSKGWMPAHPTFFLKKQIYLKHGLFDLIYKISSDYDFMLRVLKDSSYKFGYLPKVISKMRIGGASNYSFLNIINKSIEDYKIIKKNKIGNLFTLIRKNTSKFKQFFAHDIF